MLLAIFDVSHYQKSQKCWHAQDRYLQWKPNATMFRLIFNLNTLLALLDGSHYQKSQNPDFIHSVSTCVRLADVKVLHPKTRLPKRTKFSCCPLPLPLRKGYSDPPLLWSSFYPILQIRKGKIILMIMSPPWVAPYQSLDRKFLISHGWTIS